MFKRARSGKGGDPDRSSEAEGEHVPSGCLLMESTKSLCMAEDAYRKDGAHPARIASASPGTSRSITLRVASGVTSRGPSPVPPAVTISSYS